MMLTRVRDFLKTFRSDEDGAILILFGLSFPVLILAVGIAIDTSRIYHTKSRLATAVDAAVLAAGKSLLDGRMTDEEIEQQARDYLNGNLSPNGDGSIKFGQIADATIDVNRENSSVSIQGNATVPTTVMRVAGVTEVNFPINSEARFDQRDIELTMALDLTGSMNRGSRLSDLKDATTDLIDILIPEEETSNEIRIGFAPYSSGVNAGNLTEAVTGETENIDDVNCTFEREGADLVTDEAPEDGAFLLDNTDAEIGNQERCPSTKVQPLTDSKSELKSSVANFRATGTTAGHLGIQWAWYLLSDAWSGILPSGSEPASYSDNGTIKAAVIMTDGRFNTFKGDFTGPSQTGQVSRQICTEMRDNNILVFTVGFELDDDNALSVLSDCAGNKDRFFRAENGDQLRAAFTDIAFQLNRLRLSQ